MNIDISIQDKCYWLPIKYSHVQATRYNMYVDKSLFFNKNSDLLVLFYGKVSINYESSFGETVEMINFSIFYGYEDYREPPIIEK